jgi:hypothetical protein
MQVVDSGLELLLQVGQAPKSGRLDVRELRVEVQIDQALAEAGKMVLESVMGPFLSGADVLDDLGFDGVEGAAVRLWLVLRSRGTSPSWRAPSPSRGAGYPGRERFRPWVGRYALALK